MNLESRLEEGIVVLTLSGEIDSVTKEDIESKLNELIKTDYLKIVVDLEKVTFMSSTGMSIFLEYLNRLRKLGGDLRMSRVQADVMRVFRFTKLVEVFLIYDTPVDAVASFTI